MIINMVLSLILNSQSVSFLGPVLIIFLWGNIFTQYKKIKEVQGCGGGGGEDRSSLMTK